jgi:hypothetical protein
MRVLEEYRQNAYNFINCFLSILIILPLGLIFPKYILAVDFEIKAVLVLLIFNGISCKNLKLKIRKIRFLQILFVLQKNILSL